MTLQREYEVELNRDELNWSAREVEKYAKPKRELIKSEPEDPAEKAKYNEARLIVELSDKLNGVAKEGMQYAVAIRVKRDELLLVKKYCGDDEAACAAVNAELEKIPEEETYTIKGDRWALKAMHEAVSISLTGLTTRTIPYYVKAPDSDFPNPLKPRMFYLGKARDTAKFLEQLQRKLDEALK